MTHDIVLLSTADWDNPFWTNKQHVAVELARRGHRILYIDSVGLRRPTSSIKDLSRILLRVRRAMRSPRQVRKDLWVWSPLVLPWQNNYIVRRLNRLLLGAGLKSRLRVTGMKREWLWTYNPLTVEFFDCSKFRRTIYHCVDEIKAQPGMPVNILGVAEEQLGRSADVIFTTSTALTESRRAWNEHTYYLPNVADYEHFSSAMSAETQIPGDLVDIKEPRLGFIGAISGYKVDFQLIRSLADALPDCSIVLIGGVGEGDPQTDISKLEGAPNIWLLGPRHYSTLPGYLKGFQVALLPSQINEYTDAMFPMKLFEYLAAGCPVVSTDLRAIREYTDVVSLARSPQEFVSLVAKSLSGCVPSLDRRLAIAQKHTYMARTGRMLSLIEEGGGDAA